MTYNVEPLFGMLFNRTAVDFDKSQALCRGRNTNHWFPEQGQSRGRQFKAAVALCKRCPVQTECLRYGVATGSCGIWGGVSLTFGKPRKQYRKES